MHNHNQLHEVGTKSKKRQKTVYASNKSKESYNEEKDNDQSVQE